MWNSRALWYRRTRSVEFIWRTCVAILIGAVLIAMLMQSLRDSKSAGRDGKSGGQRHPSGLEEYSSLLSAQDPSPQKLAAWLRKNLERWDDDGEPFDQAKLSVANLELKPLFEKHLRDASQSELFGDYVRCRLLAEGSPQFISARERLHDAAAQRPPARFANEFHGDVLDLAGKESDALAAFLIEGGFEDARYARSRAVELADSTEDEAVARRLCGDVRYVSEMDGRSIFRLAKLAGNHALVLRGIIKMQWQRWAHGLLLGFALLAASVWYFLLVYSSAAGRWRWLRFLFPVLAGIMSVWLLTWMHGVFPKIFHHHDDDDGTVALQILHWIVYVGIPEEAVKLLLFAPFIPLLLRERSGARAALTAGCVGLGFALNENLEYFARDWMGGGGGASAVVRLVTANFLHISLTGIAGFWLYELLRTKFNRAGEFLAAFAAVAVAHGLYDFACGATAREWGMEVASVIVLALAARFYLEQIRPDVASLRLHVISSTSVFCVGSALLVGFTIIAAVWQANSMKAAATALQAAIGMAPVGLIYVRAFREV